MKKIRVYYGYDPVRIIGSSRGDVTNADAAQAELSGPYLETTNALIPQDPKYRGALEVKGDSVVINPVKKQAIDDKLQAQADKRTRIIDKLKQAGFDEADLDVLLNQKKPYVP